MANVKIGTVAGGENAAPAGTEKILLDNGSGYKWASLTTIRTFFKTTYDALYMALVAPGTAGNLLISDGDAWSSATLASSITPGTSGNILTSNGTIWTSAAPAAAGTLGVNNSTITTGNLTCAEDNVYNCTIAGLTANRNVILPVASAAGKTIRINIIDGDATYVLVIIGAATVTIDGGSAATEWSRLFIINETITLESTSTTNWKVIQDGRKSSIGIMSRAAAQTISHNSITKIEFDTVVSDRGGIVDDANDKVTIRRAGLYEVNGFVSTDSAMDDQEKVQCLIYIDGALYTFSTNMMSTASSNQYGSAGRIFKQTFTAGQYIELDIYHSEGANVNTDTNSPPALEVIEIL